MLAALDPFAPKPQRMEKICRLCKGLKKIKRKRRGLVSRNVGVKKKTNTVNKDGWNTYAPKVLKDYQITSHPGDF